MLIKSAVMMSALAAYVGTFILISEPKTSSLELTSSLFSPEQNLLLHKDVGSLLFSATVATISAMVYFYSKFYFQSPQESAKDYFFFYNLGIFISSMVFLIASGNLIFMMIGWDGLGVTSFLLITYYNNMTSNSSALATFSLNRVGDLFMVSVLALLLTSSEAPVPYGNAGAVVGVFFLLGCLTKSAQLPFSAWLPAAMAAPTPVSSLVHSSTLVTAGIYMLLKFNFLVVSCTEICFMIMVSACILSLISGVFATKEKDMKKMVAMSTLSQLGILMFCLMSGNSNLTLFHIISHATFKSLLFMMSGILIICSANYQDMRKTALSKNSNFLVCVALISSVLNLMGMPFMSGFYSKDSIILAETGTGANLLVKIIFILSCMMSVMYCAKIISSCFFMLYKPITSAPSTPKPLIAPSASLLLIISIGGGKFYFLTLMDKESYKLMFFEKMLGIIVITLVLVMMMLMQRVKQTKSEVKNPRLLKENHLFVNMVNLKFLSISAASALSVKLKSLLFSEKMFWELITKGILQSMFLSGPSPVKMSKTALMLTIFISCSLLLTA